MLEAAPPNAELAGAAELLPKVKAVLAVVVGAVAPNDGCAGLSAAAPPNENSPLDLLSPAAVLVVLAAGAAPKENAPDLAAGSLAAGVLPNENNPLLELAAPPPAVAELELAAPNENEGAALEVLGATEAAAAAPKAKVSFDFSVAAG